MNRKGSKPEILDDQSEEITKPVVIDYENGVGQDSLTRFDTSRKRSGNKNKRSNNRPQFTNPEQGENKGNGLKFQKPIKKNENGASENNE